MQDVFGGGQGMGIHPCTKVLEETGRANVLLYSNPERGELSGYYDGWLPTEDHIGPVFEYTGDGEGDQVFVGRHGQRNGAVLMHVDDNRDLRVFKADGKVPGSKAKRQRYIGKFELDADQPYVVRQAPNLKGDLRRVIVFRLRPVEDVTQLPQDIITPSDKTECAQVPADITTSVMVEPESHSGKPISRSAIPRTKVSRREASLCEDFRKLLEEHEHEVSRFQIRAAGLSSTLLTDLYDTHAHVLYEAKGNSSREAVRMAIGQLMDYRRHVTPADPTLAILLPTKPHEDLVDLLESVNVKVVYRHRDSFVGWPVKAHAPG